MLPGMIAGLSTKATYGTTCAMHNCLYLQIMFKMQIGDNNELKGIEIEIVSYSLERHLCN